MAASSAPNQNEQQSFPIDGPRSEVAGSSGTGAVKFPDFSKSRMDRVLFAQASRSAGRLNAASISPDEISSLLAEREALLDKRFSNTMSESEERRLEYVRWSLDRIDDAQTGEILDRLEGYLSQYEDLLRNIGDLRQQLDGMVKRK